MAGPPISNGAVLISRARIVATGKWRDLKDQPSARTFDLEDSVLLPGLINAHCHLDYTGMAGQFKPPDRFVDWLKAITEAKAGWNYADYAASWRAGARMLLQTGTTTVADMEAVPELLPEMWRSTPLRVVSFLEMIGLAARRSPATVMQEALDALARLGRTPAPVGLGPHAPYSTVPALLRLASRAARRRRTRLCVHVAESAVEYEMFAYGRGDMFEWMERSGRDMADCGTGSPVEHLARCGVLGENLIAVHLNYPGQRDLKLLREAGVHVAHCPRSHEYFRHAPFPLNRLRRGGINLCLGTDSLASVCKRRHAPLQLDMFEEMRALARRNAGLAPKYVLQMATLNSARALGLTGRIGQLAPGAGADLVALSCGSPGRNVYEAVLDQKAFVRAVMIAGDWVLGPAAAETSKMRPQNAPIAEGDA